MDVGVTETPSGILIIPLLSRWLGNLPHLPLSIRHILLPIYMIRGFISSSAVDWSVVGVLHLY